MPMRKPTTRTGRHRFVRIGTELLVGAVILAACSSGQEVVQDETQSPSTTAEAREVAEPATTSAPQTTSTTTTTEPPIDVSLTMHVLGSIRNIPIEPPDDALAPTLAVDDATIASIGCAPSTGCATTDLTSWAANEIDALNLATLAATVDGLETLESTSSSLALSGIATFGYGDTIEQAASPAIVGTNDASAALFGYSPAVDPASGLAATETGRGVLAGPDGLAALTEAVEASQAAGNYVIVFVDWALSDARAPTETELADIETISELGVDAIVGHGSDFLQRFELVGESAVAFDLGSAVTTSEDQLRRDTALLRLHFDDPIAESCLLPAQSGPDGLVQDDPTKTDCA